MKYRQIADTDLTVSEIGVPLRPLATNDYGHVTEQDAVNLLRRAFDVGVTYFDVADSYTEGYGEGTLARALGRNRHDIVISTKAGYDFYRPVIDPSERGKSQRWTPGFIQYACEQSLRRLDTDYLDLFLLHHPDPNAIEDDELFGMLDELVTVGKTRYYGVALDDKPESEESGEGAVDDRQVAALHATFNLIDQQPGRRLITRAQEGATALIAYDPSAAGRTRESAARGWRRRGSERAVETGSVRRAASGTPRFGGCAARVRRRCGDLGDQVRAGVARGRGDAPHRHVLLPPAGVG